MPMSHEQAIARVNELEDAQAHVFDQCAQALTLAQKRIDELEACLRGLVARIGVELEQANIVAVPMAQIALDL